MALKPLLDKGEPEALAAALIGKKAVNLFLMLADILDQETDNILSDKIALARLCNAEFFIEAMLAAVEIWSNVRVTSLATICSPAWSENVLETWPKACAEDFMAFSVWAIWRGADGATQRKYIKSRTLKSIQKIEKVDGVDGMIARLWRSLMTFRVLLDKLFIPKIKEMNKVELSAFVDSTNINSMKTAFSFIQKRA